MIKNPIPISFNLDGQHSVQSVCAVIHIDDTNTETLDLSLVQGGEHITVSSESTVTARFARVKDKILISDNVACEVQENGNIHIPIDNAAAHMLVGEIKIEINIVDENDILTMQFPLVIRVNNTILADAEISPESEGTIPELLEEAAEAAEAAQEAAENAQAAAEAATAAISTKQDKLTAGDNITIENNIISAADGATDYDELTSRPQINDVTLSGNKTSHDLGLQSELTAGNNITINNGVISADGGATSYNDLTDKPYVRVANYRSGAAPTMELTKGIEFDIYNFEGFKNIDDEISINISNLFYRFRPDAALYNFNNIDQFFLNGVFEFKYASDVRNFPADLDEIDRNKPFYVCHDINSRRTIGDSARPMIRRVIGQSATGEYLEYAQFCECLAFNGNIRQQTNWAKISGGSQIVSGIVNANGTITFTDSDGNTFTTTGSNLVTSGNEQISVGYDNGGFYFLFDDGQEGE